MPNSHLGLVFVFVVLFIQWEDHHSIFNVKLSSRPTEFWLQNISLLSCKHQEYKMQKKMSHIGVQLFKSLGTETNFLYAMDNGFCQKS